MRLARWCWRPRAAEFDAIIASDKKLEEGSRLTWWSSSAGGGPQKESVVTDTAAAAQDGQSVRHASFPRRCTLPAAASQPQLAG